MTQPLPPPHIAGLEFIRKLGSGGYADVYLYEQAMPERKVAVKVLREVGLTAGQTARFTVEANAMARLEHPHIVPVYAAGTTGDGRPYIVMMYYPQANLAERVRRERFSVAEVLRIGIQISSAVETAHRANLLHRDIKPANILTSVYGTPGLTDFGIAAQVSEADDDDTGVSVPWAPVETLYATGPATVRSDVYSLAATLWHLLVGRSPFEVVGGDNSTYALMRRVRDVPAPSTGRSDVPTSLDRLLRTAMAKDPQVRPATALQFARSLQSIEQELRLMRTDIVLAEEVRGGDDEPGTTRIAPVGLRAPQDDESTRLRAPQRVEGQRGQSASHVGRRALNLPPVGGPPPARPVTSGLSAVGDASASGHGGGGDSGHGSGGSGAGNGPGDDPRDEATIQRGVVRVDAARREPDADAAPRGADGLDAADAPDRGGEPFVVRWWFVAALVVVVAAVIVTAVILLGGEKEVLPDPTATPSETAPTMGTVETRPGDPRIEGVRTDSQVTFTWTYENTLESDTYLVKVSGETDPRSVADATVTLDSAGQVCVQVKVIRASGQYYPAEWSKEACQ